MEIWVIKNQLPNLKPLLEVMVTLELSEGNFEVEEFQISKGRIYYKHVDFNRIETMPGEYIEEKLKCIKNNNKPSLKYSLEAVCFFVAKHRAF